LGAGMLNSKNDAFCSDRWLQPGVPQKEFDC
jgi:hypothetical protein